MMCMDLQAMAKAQTGLYCAPLRLLAMEVYDSLNAQGTLCDLITGTAAHASTCRPSPLRAPSNPSDWLICRLCVVSPAACRPTCHSTGMCQGST